MEKRLIYSGSAHSGWTDVRRLQQERQERAGAVFGPGPEGPRTLQQLRLVLRARPTLPPRRSCSGEAGRCGAAHLWRCRGLCRLSPRPSLAFKSTLKNRPSQSRERGRGAAEGVCEGRGSAGLGGSGGGGRSGGIGREELPGSSREGRIGLGSAPPGGAVCL